MLLCGYSVSMLSRKVKAFGEEIGSGQQEHPRIDIEIEPPCCARRRTARARNESSHRSQLRAERPVTQGSTIVSHIINVLTKPYQLRDPPPETEDHVRWYLQSLVHKGLEHRSGGLTGCRPGMACVCLTCAPHIGHHNSCRCSQQPRLAAIVTRTCLNLNGGLCS